MKRKSLSQQNSNKRSKNATQLIEIQPKHVETAKQAILNRLTGLSHTNWVGFPDAMTKLQSNLRRTIQQGKSGSILVTGPRGSGKSSLVRQAMSNMRQEYSTEPNKANEATDTFFEIRLNGLVQTDDKIALKEIVRQLHLEMKIQNQKLSNFSEYMDFVLYALKNSSSQAVPLIIILEEFELFANHSKQTLLYNLFDITQTSTTPVFVIGISSDLMTLEKLEKRVKSRFSHQFIHLYPLETKTDFISLVTDRLLLCTEDDVLNQVYIDEFNSKIQKLRKKGTFNDWMTHVYNVNRDSRQLISIFTGAICELTTTSPFLNEMRLQSLANEQCSDFKSKLVSSLNVLEVCLLISIKNMMAKQFESFNFEMVYDDYKEFTNRMSTYGRHTNLFYKRSLAHKSYERLAELSFIKYIEGVNAKGPREQRMVQSLVTRDVVLDSVLKYSQNMPDVVLKWVEY